MVVHVIEPERRTLHGVFARDLPPVLTIDPGDTVRLRTLDAGWNLEPRRSADPADHPRKFAPRDPLRDAVARCLPGPVILDCSHAELPDSVLGILALWLSDLDRPVLAVHGLPRHGEAILRSFGCGWALPLPAQAGSPESR